MVNKHLGTVYLAAMRLRHFNVLRHGKIVSKKQHARGMLHPQVILYQNLI